jgi:hypothetical protein
VGFVMGSNDFSQIYDLLEKCNGKLYVSCSGEEDYPNVSVREVFLLEDNTFGYYDEDGMRTVELMKNRPNVTLQIENEKFHGFKAKGKASFKKEFEIGIKKRFSEERKTFKNPIAVVTNPQEVFPY